MRVEKEGAHAMAQMFSLQQAAKWIRACHLD